MRILIYGAGAVGGYLGGILTAAGADVTLVARGAHYDALARRGLILEGPKSGRPAPIPVRAVRPGEEQPPFDLIFVGLKSHQLVENAGRIAALLAPQGSVILPQNGIPYWYFEKLDSPLRGSRLASVDPDGVLAGTIPIDAVIGGVINKPADLAEPGRIRLADQPGDRLVIGELDGRITKRLEAIKSVIEPAGWPVLVTDNIRAYKWRKQLSNAVFNPIGALTQSSARQIGGDEPARRVAKAMMEEVIAVAVSVGVAIDMTPDEMLDGTQKRVQIPSSTLQDVRGGRALELDAIVNGVIDIGRLTGVPTPRLEVAAAFAGLLNRRIVEDGWAIAPAAARRA
ncbi:MAG: 2-dehydropantoate 2-reductase [Betaproteobacteria bacterium]|nr:2-dehydropantoate 2-reductase [Betaproteobacteria bacterium]